MSSRVVELRGYRWPRRTRPGKVAGPDALVAIARPSDVPALPGWRVEQHGRADQICISLVGAERLMRARGCRRVERVREGEPAEAGRV